ncbi:phosphoribosylamine--glycine ligase [Paucilactobacillus oligofermentans DSM 15707 = LMG 22743]|uniref:Phosphoribosylamine--glycine ligase n=1 Tax=Paucilactobacillus oligofermentans DSM 15707 = LMG 22743 TaxID=1423778 RepID=A0A0R1RF28_9LACO|nr:phosphoribosylamine--glycine ligase [Paucilactobacillus oligofermentans]KRL55398.1 phosphoribosylamine--glycine ligase [Paucilactobacillus oligofermentans DSM 15707 = LMG 22743]CUS25612.1 Phosphoribosylamine--glycine ligase PurD [Paucilactobacillus oligofermentans DSM 15707 = LMG 22743]
MAKVLVIGSGAREHAICRQFLKSEHVETVFCAPGNPGMQASNLKLVPIDELAFDELINFAKLEHIDLTVVGPEVPLQAGIVDYFMAADLKIFGPTKNAARLEGSKTFAKEQMEIAQIPTAEYQNFSDEIKAIAYLNQVDYPIVIKSDGLAAGKGVVIATDYEMAIVTVHEMLGESKFAADEIVIEEFLIGQEFSFFTFVNGTQIIPMPLAQDHKAAYDGDLGPNTGGMGAYSPVPQISQEIRDATLDTIIQPIVNTMAAGNPFCGILYTGLIATDSGPKVIEFNVRFGDPETSVVLPQLKTDFYELLIKLLNHELQVVEWQSDQTYLCVGVASKAYPQSSGSGVNLSRFLETPTDIQVDFAGTKQVDDTLVSSGGRILSLVTHANSVESAQDKIYQWLDQQSIDGLRYRRDIGDKAYK